MNRVGENVVIDLRPRVPHQPQQLTKHHVVFRGMQYPGLQPTTGETQIPRTQLPARVVIRACARRANANTQPSARCAPPVYEALPSYSQLLGSCSFILPANAARSGVQTHLPNWPAA